MSLLETDKRELCPRCGWVGRRAFQQDRHDLCEPPDESRPDEADEADEDAEDDEVLDATEEGVADPPQRDRASPRRRGIPPKKTLARRRITQADLATGRSELQVLGADGPYWRPKIRGDCSRVPRPCPYVACSENLFLDVSPTGSIILNFPHLEPGEMPADQSCALDLADRGPMTLEEIAAVTNLTRERIRQVEMKALVRRARPAAIALGLSSEDAAAAGLRRQVGPGADLEETGIEGAPSALATILSDGDD